MTPPEPARNGGPGAPAPAAGASAPAGWAHPCAIVGVATFRENPNMATAARHCRATDRRTERGIMAAVNVHVRGQRGNAIGFGMFSGTNDPPHLAHSGRMYPLVQLVSGYTIPLPSRSRPCCVPLPLRSSLSWQSLVSLRPSLSTSNLDWWRVRWSASRSPTSGAPAPVNTKASTGFVGGASSPTSSRRTSASSRRCSTSGRAQASSTTRPVRRREPPPARPISRSRSSSRRVIRSREESGP